MENSNLPKSHPIHIRIPFNKFLFLPTHPVPVWQSPLQQRWIIRQDLSPAHTFKEKKNQIKANNQNQKFK